MNSVLKSGAAHPETVVASSILENFDSLSNSSEPLHPPTIEVSWGQNLGQFLQEQVEDSTVGN